MKRFGWVLLVVVWGCVALAPCAALAQDSGRAAAKGSTKASAPKKVKGKRAKATKDKDKVRDNKAPVRNASHDKSESPATVAAPDAQPRPGGVAHAPSEDAAALAADADERVRKEAGEEIKTVEFGGLDIEGQLKTPQMLYFLNRLRAEFSRPELPHRSFIPELQRGTKESAF
jgi:hypothetical protein